MQANHHARFPRRAVATLLSLATVATLGCSTAQSYSLRDNLATIHVQHDADDIGAIDGTAPPTNLDDYRHANAARYQTTAIERHPVR